MLSHAHSSLSPQSPSHFGAFLQLWQPSLRHCPPSQAHHHAKGRIEASRSSLTAPLPAPTTAISDVRSRVDIRRTNPRLPIGWALALPLSFTIPLRSLSRITLLVLTSFSCLLLQDRSKPTSSCFKMSPSVHQVINNSGECLKYTTSSPSASNQPPPNKAFVEPRIKDRVHQAF